MNSKILEDFLIGNDEEYGLEDLPELLETVCNEIARLRAALAEAERQRDSLRSLARNRIGFLIGNYTCRCHMCKTLFSGDKRATTCVVCADADIDAAMAREEE